VHLLKSSPLAARQLVNWHLKIIETLHEPNPQDMHYTQVIALSKEDLKQPRENMMDWIRETQRIVRPSPEEVVACYSIEDLFALTNPEKSIL
jgi:hypothetical protein